MPQDWLYHSSIRSLLVTISVMASSHESIPWLNVVRGGDVCANYEISVRELEPTETCHEIQHICNEDCLVHCTEMEVRSIVTVSIELPAASSMTSLSMLTAAYSTTTYASTIVS